eukprot:jgi/Undpi1/10723/HiC_scaffold_29.g13171.m1
MTGGISDPEQLKEYRETWTVEADSVRPVRFVTDAVTSSNMGVPLRFRSGETRKFPGKPKAVDRLLAKALDCGNMGVVMLRKALRQRGELSSSSSSSSADTVVVKPMDLVEAMKGMGVKLDAADSEKVIECFAPAGGVGKVAASVPDIMAGLHGGGVSKRQRQAATDIFRVLDGAGTGVLTKEGLKNSLEDACAGCYEEKEAWRVLLENWSLYQQQDQEGGGEGGLTVAGLEKFVADIACGAGSNDELEAMLAPFIEK